MTVTQTMMVETAKTRNLRVPDMFAGILSNEPVQNPYEIEVASASEAWSKKIAKLDPRASKILTKANFAYLVSLSAPNADAEALRMGVDWCIWAFIFDDQFDEGLMKDKTIEAAEEMIFALAVMDDAHPDVDIEQYPLRYIFQTTWRRFQERNPSPGLQHRWKDTHRRCLFAILHQVYLEQQQESGNISVQQYMDIRRESIGSYCLFAVVEWCHDIRLPEEIMQHPSIRTCERTAADLTWLVNDVLSYKKDLVHGVEHNLIRLLMKQGQGEQAAMDRVGDIMVQCQRDWDAAVKALPSWGEKTDAEVKRYLDACRDVSRANMRWSLKSGRYLNPSEVKQVQEAGYMTLENRSEMVIDA